MYDRFIETTLSILYFTLIIVVFVNVITRYLINIPFMWAEELGRYLFVWIVYLGAAQAFKDKRHLTVDFLSNKIPNPYKTYLSLIIYVILIIFIFFLFIYGLKFVKLGINRPAYSFDIGLAFFYAAIPVGSLCMLLNIFRVIPEIIKTLKK